MSKSNYQTSFYKVCFLAIALLSFSIFAFTNNQFIFLIIGISFLSSVVIVYIIDSLSSRNERVASRDIQKFIRQYYSYQRIVPLLFFGIIAASCYIGWQYKPLSDTIRNFLLSAGNTIISSLVLTLVYEYYLSDIRSTIEENRLTNSLKAQFEKTLDKKIVRRWEETLTRILGNEYERECRTFADRGVSDCFYRFHMHKYADKLREARRIRIMAMWVDQLSDIQEEIYNAIVERDATVEIVLWKYSDTDVLKKRCEQFKGYYDWTKFQLDIVNNLTMLRQIRYRLEDKGKQNNLIVKLYSGFVACSMLGFNDCFVVGFYLFGKFSNEGMQFQVVNPDKQTKQNKGENFYREFENHFEKCLEASQDLDFNLIPSMSIAIGAANGEDFRID